MPLTTERQQIRGGVHRRVQSVAKGVPQAGDMGRTVVEGRSGMAGRLGELTEHVDRRLQSAPGSSSVSRQPSSPDTRARMCRVLEHEMRAIPATYDAHGCTFEDSNRWIGPGTTQAATG